MGAQYTVTPKPLPAQILEHCTVCFEEGLYEQAFSLLLSTVISRRSDDEPAYVPPPQYLALAATLIVHPRLTTRTTSQDKHDASDHALIYLQHVLDIAGPRQPETNEAYRFSKQSVPTRVNRLKTPHVSGSSGEDDALSGRIRSPYANKEALWSNVDDFWSVVGWAFNCSVVHKHRWERWRLWLDLMLDTLESDFLGRLQDRDAAHSDDCAVNLTPMTGSLLASYLVNVGEGRGGKRKIMRAILADGKQKSLAEFGEIWKNETKLPKMKQAEPLAKRRKLDLDNGEFGDYFDDDLNDDSPDPSVRRSRSATAVPSAKASRAASEDSEDLETDDDFDCSDQHPAASALEDFGGMDSIRLRQRLLALLIRFCVVEPGFLDTEDLFDLYTEFLRPLPLTLFQQFVLPTSPYLDPDAQCSLDQMLLRPLLAGAAPAYDANALLQDDFERRYVQYAANTTRAVDNAKLSLVVESLMRLLWKTGSLRYSERLEDLVSQGNEARKMKAAFDGRRKAGSKARDEEEAVFVLECSAERMLAVVDMINTF